jgi:phage terminase Nu1 subunit (DNA packaging protein)
VPRISQEELAKHLDCTSRAIRDLIASGVLPGRSGKGYDPDASRVAYLRHLRERAAGRRGNGDLDLVQERAALARAQTESAELRNAERRGALVSAEDFDAGAIALATTISSAFQFLPSQVAPLVAPETSASRCQEILEREVHKILHDLANLGDDLAARAKAKRE